ncbi:MAG: PTS sugar transporter subunit IIA [Kofleriaceae bacterium]|nr:PTS sugar transporter subunit IIA [Myxococcales bacterium]MCB9558779.1 PTS sugar transporter subunit IIA [Kofleriaceae bacterium]MCB9570667.1 PTS sugar transporter subunit IIA [Kofleriaceae bacterium]
MKIVELIRREMIVPALVARDKPGLLEELAAHVASQNAKIDRTALTRVLIDREQLASTAIGEGVAIPHGKMSAVSEIVACLGRAPGGVDFDSMDGQPTFLFFVLVAPENSTGAHLKALARISRVFKDAEFRRRLLDAPDADAMYRVIAEEDAKY